MKKIVENLAILYSTLLWNLICSEWTDGAVWLYRELPNNKHFSSKNGIEKEWDRKKRINGKVRWGSVKVGSLGTSIGPNGATSKTDYSSLLGYWV